jgi:20S proteasome subunit beta 1
MAMSYAGGVVMGADSRTSTGNYVANRVSDKLTSVSERIYCCRSGSAADTQAVSDIVRYYLDAHTVELGRAPLVKTAASLFQELCYNNKDRLQASIICAGWDAKEGGQVYALPLGGALVRQDWAIGGSGSTYVYGFVDANYKKNMTKEECLEFTAKVNRCAESIVSPRRVVRDMLCGSCSWLRLLLCFCSLLPLCQAIALAMARDGSSGGVVRLASIDAKGVERHYIPGDRLPYMPSVSLLLPVAGLLARSSWLSS